MISAKRRVDDVHARIFAYHDIVQYPMATFG